MSLLPISRSNMFRSFLAVRKFHTSSGRFWWSYPGWWFDDHKARRWPRTAEERKAAAARYGLREGDYKPVREDYMGGRGDYPDLGEIQYGVKDPYENWSYDKYRSNFNEPLHVDSECYEPDRATFTRTERVSGWRAVAQFFILFGGLTLVIIFILEFPIRTILPMKPKQYAYDYNYAFPTFDPKRFPLTHYTFEPDEKAEAPKKEGGHH